MREIKFRAWDKENKRMIPSDDVSLIDIERERVIYHSDYGNGPRKEIAMADSWIGYELIELMQFTGLKDKNGQEIYEGDIVKARSEGKSAVGKVMQRIDGLWLLYPAWQGKEFWGLCPNNKGNTTVEVIGNIYENPELIE